MVVSGAFVDVVATLDLHDELESAVVDKHPASVVDGERVFKASREAKRTGVTLVAGNGVEARTVPAGLVVDALQDSNRTSLGGRREDGGGHVKMRVAKCEDGNRGKTYR